MYLIRRKDQRGDTLVEVLFSIAIIGLFIGGPMQYRTETFD